LLVCFFFTCAAAPRHLPSFPTRRSSDLGPQRRRHRFEKYLGLAAAGNAIEQRHPEAVDIERGDAVQRLLLVRRQRSHHGVGIGRDRKSTRLNSSHVKISYAVFCLKKKK